MKTLSTSILALLLCATISVSAQIGSPFINDVCNDMLFSQDGTFITCGSKGPNGSVYKTDCSGAIVAQIEKGYLTGWTSFWAAVELADGSIVAVGSAFIGSATDTVEEVLVLKTDANLVEIASAHFKILNKAAVAKSLTLSKTGHLLLIGEVTGLSIDFTDVFFQRVSPVTLQPTSAPVIFNNGVDLAAKITPLADEYFLISGSSFLGNIFNPIAPITNRLMAIKVDDNGSTLWSYKYEKIFPATFGVATSGGAAQNPISGNILLCGNTEGDSTGLDPIFILIDNNGMALDTVVGAAPQKQTLFNIISHSLLPNFYTSVGNSLNPAAGTPNLFAFQAYELNNAVVQTNLVNDLSILASVPDVVEYQPNRFTFAISVPDNPILLGSKDYFLVVPELGVDALYENCVLYAIDPENGPELTPGLKYEWHLNGTAVPNSNSEQFLPDGSGDYYVVVTDAAGCFAASNVVSVSYLSAAFSYTGNNLSYSFTNTSNEADTYLWNFGDGGSSLQVNPSHTYSIPGVYTVTLTATNDCGSETFTQVISTTSAAAEPSWLTSFQLSPNPSRGLVNIDMSGYPQESLMMALFSPGGQKVFSESFDFQSGVLKEDLNFSAMPAGMYILQVQAQNEVKYVRVLIAH